MNERWGGEKDKPPIDVPNYIEVLSEYVGESGVAILINNSTKKITKPYLESGGIFCFCHVTEEGWEGIRGKGEGGCGEIFL